MRVVFMGTPAYAAKILESLLSASDIEVVGVVTQEDKMVGRGQKWTFPPVKQLISESKIQTLLLQPKTLKDSELQRQIADLQPDCIIVAAFGKILPKEILSLAPCLNLHASLLPKYRGASPIQETLLAGDRITGVTLMAMEEGLDCGDILAKSIFSVGEEEDMASLFEHLSISAADLLLSALKRLETLRPVAQRHADSNYCHKIYKQDGCVSFTDSSLCLVRKLKAYAVFPGIFLENGLKIKKARALDGCAVMEQKHYKNGEILKVQAESVIVACGEGFLEILAVQPPSKKEMSAAAYINGKRLKCGDIFS